MIQSALFQWHKNFSLILICAMLGACATTQKSSTGSGDQAAAPISEAAQPQTAGKPGETPSTSSPGAAGASSSNPANTAGAAGTSSGNTGAKQGSSEGNATASDNAEAAQLKRQLAEQDAQINRLRNDQQAVAEGEEVEVAKMQEQQAVAAAGAIDQQPNSSSAAPATRSNVQDETAVFPADGNAAKPVGAESGESAVQRTLERSVYFHYNQASVPDEYDAMLTANAAYLKAHPALVTEVQGNCDERGSREYNLALGARRAEAVKRALELAGADGSRINAISYGSEKPVASGKDEESYSQNRRADIVY
jgi:peptidoglycan-associated lipoprotein